ncbi:DUF1294 domain-containing protein [Streptococcus phocae subsp. phocae]
MIEKLLILLLCWNGVVFVLYGIDKKRAIQHKWRISEKTLIVATLLCGGLGACSAAKFYHHKTQKWYFRLSWYIGLVLTMLLLYGIVKTS